MIIQDDLPKSFLDTIQPYGKEYILQLYCISLNKNENLDLSRIEGAKIETFILKDDPWNFQINLFEISFKDPKNIKINDIVQILSCGSETYNLCWMMLEGGFDITKLASRWMASQIYGYSIKGKYIEIELDLGKRQSDAWFNKYLEFIQEVYRKISIRYLDT